MKKIFVLLFNSPGEKIWDFRRIAPSFLSSLLRSRLYCFSICSNFKVSNNTIYKIFTLPLSPPILKYYWKLNKQTQFQQMNNNNNKREIKKFFFCENIFIFLFQINRKRIFGNFSLTKWAFWLGEGVEEGEGERNNSKTFLKCYSRWFIYYISLL